MSNKLFYARNAADDMNNDVNKFYDDKFIMSMDMIINNHPMDSRSFTITYRCPTSILPSYLG